MFLDKILFVSEITTRLTSVIVIIYGISMALYSLVKTGKKDDIHLTKVRMEISLYITLGLSLILAGDVIKIIRVPSYKQLGKTGIVIGILQFVSQHLDQELENLRKIINQKKS